MHEFDSSQNDTEFQLKSPNWAGGHSLRGPESASHESTESFVASGYPMDLFFIRNDFEFGTARPDARYPTQFSCCSFSYPRLGVRISQFSSQTRRTTQRVELITADPLDFSVRSPTRSPTQRVELILEAVLVAMMGGCCGTRRGSRGRWRKPLRISVHGKGLEGGGLERRSGGAGVRCASWCA